jgi:hypothetical protein
MDISEGSRHRRPCAGKGESGGQANGSKVPIFGREVDPYPEIDPARRKRARVHATD